MIRPDLLRLGSARHLSTGHPCTEAFCFPLPGQLPRRQSLGAHCGGISEEGRGRTNLINGLSVWPVRQLLQLWQALHVNAATNERFFSQTGLTHTKLRSQMSHVTVTKIARLRAELYRDLPCRKKKPVVVEPAASSSSAPVPSAAPSDADDAFLDLDTLTSAAEFDAEVNEWFQELQREALDEDPEWEEDEPAKAIQNAPLAKICGHALQPLVSEEQVAAY